MHLLATQQTLLADGAEAVDLCQSPADIIIISAADTELTLLAHTYTKYCNNLPTLRLANALHLSHNMSVDLYTEKIVKKAKLVIVRLLGGRNYWPYGVDEISRTLDLSLNTVASRYRYGLQKLKEWVPQELGESERNP